MQLKEFKIESHRRKPPALRINGQSNILTFTKSSTEFLNLETDDLVKVFQDADDPKTWYFQINKVDGFKLRKHTFEDVFMFARKQLVVKMFYSLGLSPSGKSVLFEIGDPEIFDGSTYYKLIPQTN